MVEFLLAFPPILLLFLGLLQSGMLFVAQVFVHHAATNTARAAAVVIGDDPKRYGGEPAHQVIPDGKRYGALRSAALITLGPLILNGTVQSVTLILPPEGVPSGPAQKGTVVYMPMGVRDIPKVRIRLEVEVACRIPIVNRMACPWRLDLRHLRHGTGFLYPSQWIEAEAIFPYQGASYEYAR